MEHERHDRVNSNTAATASSKHSPGQNVSALLKSDVDSVIARVLGLDMQVISDDISYQSISEWDSLAHVNLMLELEQTFSVEVDAESVVSLTSVSKIQEFVRNARLPAGSEQPEPATAKTSVAEVSRTTPVVHRGLNGIVFDNSRICAIDGEAGTLQYRGYAIQELAQESSFEEIVYLLLYGELPNANQLATLSSRLAARRNLNQKTIDFIRSVKQLHPTDMLRTVVSALPALTGDSQQQDRIGTSLDLIAKFPVIIVAHNACRNNQEFTALESDEALGHAANFLYLLRGHTPLEEEVRILDQDMILHAEHESNASTFSARVVAATQADLYAAITAALAAFVGPLHGGAQEKVMAMLEEIKHPENAGPYVEHRVKNGLPVFGFGHRVYRVEDPRAKHLRRAAWELSVQKGDMRWLDILAKIEESMSAYAKYGMNINDDFYAAVVYHLLGIPHDMFVAVFASSRIAGWCAHVTEQLENNILIRPRLSYVGESGRKYVARRQHHSQEPDAVFQGI